MKNVTINFDVRAIIKQLQPEIKKKLVKMATDNFNKKTAHLHDEIAAEGGTITIVISDSPTGAKITYDGEGFSEGLMSRLSSALSD